MDDTRFSSRQRLVAFLCFFAYLSAYLTRLNISIALPDITEHLGYSDISAVSFIPGTFFWCYALGQLVSGWVGDRVSPKYMIGIGLAGSSLFNILFSLCGSLIPMIFIWGLNGIFQSMLWAPIMRTIVLNFSGKRLGKMTFMMSMTLVFGYSISWSASTVIKNILSWRYVFIVPAALAAVFVCVWFLLYKKEGEISVEGNRSADSRVSALFRLKYFPVMLCLILFVSLSHGIIKESINTWLPTMLESVGIFSLSSTLGVLIIVPVVNFTGIVLMKLIMSKGKANSFFTVFILLVLSLIVAAFAALFSNIHIAVLIGLTIAMSGLTFATNPVLTAYFPIEFARWNCVSTFAGIIDCTIYIGAALSSPLTGLLVNGNDWTPVTVMWVVVLLLASFVSLFLKKCSARFFSNN